MTALFETYRQGCTARLVGSVEPRPGNALNVEIGAGGDRCMDKTPDTWRGRGVTGFRWIASGGDPKVFGFCCPVCPRLCSHEDGGKCWWCTDLEERENADIEKYVATALGEGEDDE